MVSVRVEKEIKKENHIIGPFTIRQALFLLVAVILSVVTFLIIRPSSVDIIIPILLVYGGLVYYFGFHTKHGLHMEYFLIKTTKSYIFANNRRKYRTKNSYITMLNTAYNSEKMADMQDKRKRKLYEKAQKRAAKKKTKLIGYK